MVHHTVHQMVHCMVHRMVHRMVCITRCASHGDALRGASNVGFRQSHYMGRSISETECITYQDSNQLDGLFMFQFLSVETHVESQGQEM